jgi:hypothetical protein
MLTNELKGLHSYFLHYFVLVFAIEGRTARKQNEKDYTTRPDIAFLIISLFNNFRGDIIRSTHSGCHLFTTLEDSRSAKIDYFQSFSRFIIEQILRL